MSIRSLPYMINFLMIPLQQTVSPFPSTLHKTRWQGHVFWEIFSSALRSRNPIQSSISSDPYGEVTLYIVHGFLHLLGYDDIEESDEKEMRSEEKNCIVHLEKHGVRLCLAGS